MNWPSYIIYLYRDEAYALNLIITMIMLRCLEAELDSSILEEEILAAVESVLERFEG